MLSAPPRTASPGRSRAGLALLACLWALAGLLCLAAWGCSRDQDDDYQASYVARPASLEKTPQYTFAVHPLHNPKRLFALYQPLMDTVNRGAKGQFTLRLVASRDYAAFERRLKEGRFSLALPNPLQTLLSQRHGYRIVGKMGDDQSFRGFIVVRRDSGILFAEDLQGKAISFPAPTAVAATMLPKLYLYQRGLNLNDNDLRYVGSQESAIMNVFLGKTAAAGTWSLPWKLFLENRPEMCAALEVRWTTPPLVNNGLVARDDMPPEHVEQIMKILLALPQSPQGRAILRDIGIPSFEREDTAALEAWR